MKFRFCDYILFYKFGNIESNWVFSSYNFFNYSIDYIDFLIFLLFIFLLFNLVRFIKNINIKSINKSNNQFLNDEAIEFDKEDKLNYKPIVDKTTNILLNENFEKSFTIGLVGPWGNGKSSVLNLIYKKINEKRINDTITINFQPYLNHNEDDIINEFFTSLSNELSKYNGKLSDVLEEYSEKVTNLYDNKNVFGLIKDHVTNFNDSTAGELYKLINTMLTETNKKIIVFIDDLDRLNEKEILEILKLIRNTADFRNTIFLVAMDKQYVLRRLKESSKISNTSFIDKFFQLEIYLPEIDNSFLREYFISELSMSYLNDETSDFSFRIKNAIEDKSNLFNDYIKNIRDVKRLINQVIYDYPNTGGEIDFKDFLNFTYFKLKFPNFINILKLGIRDFIELDSGGIYNLKKISEDEFTDAKQYTQEKWFKILSKNKNFNPKQYDLYKQYNFKNCLIEDYDIDCDNKFLLLKTLAFLFGDENIVNDVNSIKYENNLGILLEQKVYKNKLLNKEFKDLFKSDLTNIKSLINDFNRDNKLQQLLSRFRFFTSSKEANEYKNAILILVYLFDERNNFSLNEQTIINQIAIFSDKLNSFFENQYESNIKNWSLENIFENHEFNLETRLLLFGYLKNGNLGNKVPNFWGFNDKSEVHKIIIRLFKEFLDDYISYNINKKNDYLIFNIYNLIKLEIESDLKNIIKETWINKNLELFCVHVTNFDTWSALAFKISDIVNEFFNSKKDYIDFVKNHKEAKTPQIREFLSLYKLLEISEFKYSCIYTFEKSFLMLNKIEYQKKINRDEDENKDLIQLVLKTNSESLYKKLQRNNNLTKAYNYRIHKLSNSNDELYFLFVYLNKKLQKDPVLTFSQKLYHSIFPIEDWENEAFVASNIKNGKNLIPQKNNNNYLKIYSIIPRNNNFYYEIY